MDWDDDAKELFDNIVAEIPMAFRNMAKGPMQASIDGVCGDRGGDSINFDDVIRGNIKGTPAFQKSGIRPMYEKLGIDLGPYEDIL